MIVTLNYQVSTFEAAIPDYQHYLSMQLCSSVWEHSYILLIMLLRMLALLLCTYIMVILFSELFHNTSVCLITFSCTTA